MQRVDLGCGPDKHHDCTGLDVAASVQPDILHDLNDPLPFDDDSVSFLLASRSLEYTADLRRVMREIYRVCQHKTIVCIVAPHAQAAIHVANPSIRSHFNEYTPYYLTPKEHHHEIISASQFSPEFIPSEEIEVDFRLLRMEFFYFPLYLSPLYEPSERLGLMEVQMNMVDEILYHFAVVKQPITKEECSRLAGGVLEEPTRIKQRRLHDGMLTRQSADNAIENEPDLTGEQAEAETTETGSSERKSPAGAAKPKPKADPKARLDPKAKPKAKSKAGSSKTKKQMQIKMVEPEETAVPRVAYRPSRVVYHRKD